MSGKISAASFIWPAGFGNRARARPKAMRWLRRPRRQTGVGGAVGDPTSASLRAKRSNPHGRKGRWIASSLTLLAMTPGARRNQKGGRRARRLIKPFPASWVPGRSGAPPGLEGYFLDFFFDFDFFAFFAFFAFLAIVSSQGLMDGNATRGMLGGGPASQHPRR